MHVTISKLKISSVGNLLGIMYAVLGLIGGLFITIFSLAVPGAGAFGALSIIILPIMYGIIGYVAGIVSAWLYNLIAKWVGGIQFESK